MFVLFNSTPDLRAHSADRHETLTHDPHLGALYNPSPKIWGTVTYKISGAKNVRNMARFYTTSDFDRQYLRNETRYPKSKRRDLERFLLRSAKQVR